MNYIPQRKIYDAGAELKARTARRSRELYVSSVPFSWLAQAISDPSHRLALVLRAFMDMENTAELRVSLKICRHAGIVDRHQRRRCLKRLAKTGLFDVSMERGRCPVVQRKW